ncbi:MAG: hypothetical protein WAZ12_05550 [Candidatus Absconditicoccaceae bacterium]
MNKKIIVNDKMQKGYIYYLVEDIGKNFREDFLPQLTPQEMLEAGVFGGKYMTDCQEEFPIEWFENAKIAPDKKDQKLNFFGVNASMDLKYWKEKGRIYPDDPRGWFQRYCRYYIGRRITDEDNRQIKRWRAIKRHWMAVKNNCYPMDWNCRKRQRQALLHRAYDSRKL